MHNKTITIFLGSSITELKEERDKIKIMITDLNTKLEKRNITILLYACEQKDYIYNGRSQDDINTDVKRSDYSIFIIGKNMGERTREEFDIALDNYKKVNKPNILVMFKKVEEKKHDNVTEFQSFLSDELDYYYREYQNSDEAANIVAMLINKYCEDILESRADGIYLDGDKIYDYSSIEVVSNNLEIIKLKDNILKLNEHLKNNPNDEETKIEISKEVDLVNKLSKKLGTIHLSLLDSTGFGNTKEYNSALAEFKAGNTKTAIGYLEDKREERHEGLIEGYKSISQKLKNSVESLIKENALLIQLKNLEKVDNDGIKKLYEENILLERIAGLEPKSEYEYGNYLFGIIDYSNAFSHIFSYLLYQYNYRMHSNDQLYDLAKAYLRLGTIYSHLFQFDDALFCYQKSSMIHEEIYKKDNNLYLYERADAYNKLGNCCDDIKDYVNGEKYHQKAIDIYEAYSDSNKAIYELGYSYNKQGNIFRHKGIDNNDPEALEKALYYYNKNKEFTSRYDSQTNTQTLGINEKSIGLTYFALKDYKKAIEHFDESLSYLEDSYKKNISFIKFQYAKVSFHKAEALYLLDADEYEDDIIVLIHKNQEILEQMYTKKINLREVLFELYRSNNLLYKLKNKEKYLIASQKYKDELDNFVVNKVFSISKGF